VSESLRFFLKKNQRILKRSEFVSISESGHRFYADFFIALAMPAGSGCSRMGITVSRKVGGAVQRNRIKRLAREAFRLNRHLLTRPLDINLIARKTAAEKSNRVILQALQDLFEKMPRQVEH
jgi:ribonuclease P protein component